MEHSCAPGPGPETGRNPMRSISALFAYPPFLAPGRNTARDARRKASAAATRRVAWLALSVSLLCCAPEAKSSPLDRSPEPAPRADARLQGTALLLAGMAPPTDNPLAPLAARPEFQRHARGMDLFWAGLRTDSLDAIGRWQATEIPAPQRENGVLYPLSGADFLNAYSFFPDARDYVMVAMEPPGRPPVLNEATLDYALKTVGTGLWWFSKKNYFTTVGMRESMKSAYAEGVIPMAMAFLARLGHSIVSIEGVEVSPGGKLAPVEHDRATGFRLVFVDAKSGKTKELVYLKTKLSDETADPATPVGAFLAGLGRRSMMLKSAEYFFHLHKNDRLRDFLMAKSDLVMQDDAGIPYRYFRESARWNGRHYGYFVHPLPLNELRYPPQQPDLAQAFAASARPVPFSYGYGSLRPAKGLSNVTVLTRKPD